MKIWIYENSLGLRSVGLRSVELELNAFMFKIT